MNIVLPAKQRLILIGLVFVIFSSPLSADTDPRCRTVRMGTVGWLDAGASSSIAHALLLGLGYNATIQRISTPDILASLKNEDLDVFFELMIPTMGDQLRPYLLDNSVELLTKNLAGTKYSLAANKSANNIGIRHFNDISSFSSELGHTIYSSEYGSDGHQLVQKLIDQNLFNLGTFKVAPVSESELIAKLTASTKSASALVFLGWEPHPMNIRFDLSFLPGGEAVFGENFGGADVYTVIRQGLSGMCPNLIQFLTNLRFKLALINEIMTGILDLNARPTVAAVASIRQQPDLLKPWLENVTHANGQNGLRKVKEFLGLDQ